MDFYVTKCQTQNGVSWPCFLPFSASLFTLSPFRLLLFHPFVCRDVFDELATSALVVYLAAVMLQPVAHDEPPDAKLDVVSADLFEDLLRNVNCGRFVLDNHQRLSLLAIDHRVASLPGAVQIDGHFVADALSRIAFLPNQIVDEVQYLHIDFFLNFAAKLHKR